MNTIKEIKSAIKRLPGSSLTQLSNWFEQYLAEKWESRFVADVKAGRLDKLGDAADCAFERGKVRPL